MAVLLGEPATESEGGAVCGQVLPPGRRTKVWHLLPYLLMHCCLPLLVF